MRLKAEEGIVASAGWTTFDHGADIGIRGWGASLEEAFAQGAAALMSLIDGSWERVQPQQAVVLQTSSYDLEGLFVAWINTLLAEAELRHMVFCAFVPRIAGTQLEATVWGEPVGVREHDWGVEVKGATFSELFVGPQDGGWVAQCVVDV